MMIRHDRFNQDKRLSPTLSGYSQQPDFAMTRLADVSVGCIGTYTPSDHH
jgi:hypothetical protein